MTERPHVSDAVRELLDSFAHQSVEIVATIKSDELPPILRDMKRRYRSRICQNKGEWEIRIRGNDAAKILTLLSVLPGAFVFDGEKYPLP